MSPTTMRSIRRLEGHHISVCLRDGARLDDVTLMSAGRGSVGTLWLVDSGEDRFVGADDVIDVWEVA